jgi:catalase
MNGLVAEGTFMATLDAARLSKAVIFNGSPILVTVRFSNSTGIPNLPDGSALANPHGMAIKFHVPDGSETDIVINSLIFPVSSGADFRDMLLAVAESPPGAGRHWHEWLRGKTLTQDQVWRIASGRSQ